MKFCNNPSECNDLDCFDCEFAVDTQDPDECKSCGLYEKGCDQECQICPGINS